MFPLIYIEKEVANHPKVRSLCRRFSSTSQVFIDHYMEIFNRQKQHFRLQKRMPALILAKKHKNWILKTPDGYGIGTAKNFYFSHLLNCPFDCRYCFLQGMYPSAHFVFFVNQEDFLAEVHKHDSNETTFFTGYDCDSLAFESVTGFIQEWLPHISTFSACFEFRTKSVAIATFLNHRPYANVVIAYTLTPKEIGEKYEHKAPSLEARLKAIEQLQQRGWNIGLRFDPIISHPDSKHIYKTFFREVFQRVDLQRVHSASLGRFRAPSSVVKKMESLYPKESLFAFSKRKDHHLLSACADEILKNMPQERFFPCDASI